MAQLSFMTSLEQTGRVILTLIGFAGLATWAYAIEAVTQRRPVLAIRARRIPPLEPIMVLAGLAVWVLVDQVVYTAMGVDSQSSVRIAIQALCLSGALKLLLLWALFSTVCGRGLSDLFPPRGGWWTDVKTGIWGLCFSLLPVWAVGLLIQPLRNQDNGHTLIRALRENAETSTVLWIALAVLVVAPLFEEMLFRVILQGWLQDKLPPVTAIVVVAVAFVAVHGQAWPDPLPLIPLALMLGYIYYCRGSYLANVVAHALFNAVNLLMALTIG